MFLRLCLLTLSTFLTLFAAAAPVDFSRQIRPILSENCIFCHGPDDKKREAGLRLDVESEAKKDRDGVTAVVPGHPDKSALLQRIQTTDPDEVMPPPKLHKTVTPEQVKLLSEWIKQGAPWGKHWSYEPPKRSPLPASIADGNAIDAFLSARLSQEKLSFSPPADRATVIRRLALDLTGLPPTLAEQQLPSAEAALEYYLQQPTFGEHWASLWLDLARYADSSGYPSDQPREIWAYRDWVIRALNSNMPFDQFTIEQIAGDLLPTPTEDQLVATAFHRNTMTQNEGGTSDEEFRNAAVIDRVNTTLAVWMGTSMACAQCHTHKYDPITIKEYFQVYALLNQSADADRKDESPLHEIWKPGKREEKALVAKLLADVEAKFNKPEPDWLKGLDEWAAKAKPDLEKLKPRPDAVIAALSATADKRTPEQQNAIRTYYLRQASPGTASLRREVADLKRKVAAIVPVTVPIMKELAGKERRTSRVQLRGNWQALDEEVSGATPIVFHPMEEDKSSNRLTFARWLIDQRNPLTARVMMNRMWEQVFGIGIVRTSEEFGSQGELPFHPELLDWLAVEFMHSGWNLKHMLLLIAGSRAYAQVSRVTPEMQERDPDNRLLARGPRFRPSGELLRDQALAVSGLLSPKMFGPPVRPPAPSLGLSTAFGRANDWTPSPGEDRYRRSVYTEVRRNAPYASFMTFDATNREVCTLRRGRSNTPLQAFVTLNDPVFVETHQAMARRLCKDAADNNARLNLLFRLCLARLPTPKETATLTSLIDQSLATFHADPSAAEKIAAMPLGPFLKSQDAATLAAWTTVAGVVMNLDEFVMRK
jgi:mono/diheme cytochrome c family protein